MTDFSQTLIELTKLVPAAVTVAATKALPDTFDGKKPLPGFEGLPNYLTDGIREYDETPLEPFEIFKGCPHYLNSYTNGGAGQQQGLWMLTVLGATFMEDGRKLAHKLSKGYATYDKGETDAMYDRKMRERAEKSLGWPSCHAFENEGCKSCTACAQKGKIKSPLHLALPSVIASGPTQYSIGSGSSQGQQWPDPLAFEVVPKQEAIARINAAGYFVLTVNGDIYKIEPSGGVIVQKREGFNNVFACRCARCGDDKSISAGTAWRNSSNRREYDQIGYWPDNHGRPPKSYNLWQGWGVEPKQGNWSIIYKHILNVIAGGDKDKASYILDWCAHMVQRSWEKPGVALVLRGRKGTGKTILTEILARVIGRENTLITASGKKLFAQFNWHLADKLLIGAEEAFFVGNRELNDQLKHLLTGAEIEVEQKFGQRISMKSMHRVIMTSNHDQVINASDDERRFFVCDVSDSRRGDDPYFAPLVCVIKGEDDATLSAFMHELQTRDITDWKPEQAARKVASIDLAGQKLLSLEPPLQWLLELATTGPVAAVAHWEMERENMLRTYREFSKCAQVRGAADFNGAEMFWRSIKRLLNNEIFPGRRVFRTSGGKRFVLLPPQQELVDGFNRLLGGNVVDVNNP